MVASSVGAMPTSAREASRFVESPAETLPGPAEREGAVVGGDEPVEGWAHPSQSPLGHAAVASAGGGEPVNAGRSTTWTRWA